MNKEDINNLFKDCFDEFLKKHKDCFHFSDRVYARDFFDICFSEFYTEMNYLRKENSELKTEIREKTENFIKASEKLMKENFILSIELEKYTTETE